MLRVVSSAKVTERSPSEPPPSDARPARAISGKRAENRRMRTEALQRAALGLFLQYGVEAVTIDQIVDGARTAKGSFYRYFRDKTDLVASLVEPLRDEIRSTFDRCAAVLAGTGQGGDVAKPYESLAQDLIRSVLQHPDVVRLYLHESRGPKNGARAPIVELAEEVLEGATRLSNVAHERGLVRGLVGRLSAIVVVGASELIVARLFAGDDVGPVLEMPGELVSLVLDGVRARRPHDASVSGSKAHPAPVALARARGGADGQPAVSRQPSRKGPSATKKPAASGKPTPKRAPPGGKPPASPRGRR